MVKTVYIAKSDRLYSKTTMDSFDLSFSFDLETAREALESDYCHMTKRERENSNLYIEGYEIDVEDGETAEEAFNRYLEECFDMSDNISYTEVFKK